MNKLTEIKERVESAKNKGTLDLLPAGHDLDFLLAECERKEKERKAAVAETFDAVNGPRCSDCLDTGLLNNREEGDYPCTCITETNAYEFIRKAAEEVESERWSNRLEWLHTEFDADCSGVDSGDTLDCVEVEIRQALATVEKQTAERCRKIAQDCPDAYWGPHIANVIKSDFNLE